MGQVDRLSYTTRSWFTENIGGGFQVGTLFLSNARCKCSEFHHRHQKVDSSKFLLRSCVYLLLIVKIGILIFLFSPFRFVFDSPLFIWNQVLFKQSLFVSSQDDGSSHISLHRRKWNWSEWKECGVIEATSKAIGLLEDLLHVRIGRARKRADNRYHSWLGWRFVRLWSPSNWLPKTSGRKRMF